MASTPSFESERIDNSRLTFLSNVEIEIDDDTLDGDSSSLFCLESEVFLKSITSTAANAAIDDSHGHDDGAAEGRLTTKEQSATFRASQTDRRKRNEGKISRALSNRDDNNGDGSSLFESDQEVEDNEYDDKLSTATSTTEVSHEEDDNVFLQSFGKQTNTKPNISDIDDKISAILGKEKQQQQQEIMSPKEKVGTSNNTSIGSDCNTAFSAPPIMSVTDNTNAAGTTTKTSSSTPVGGINTHVNKTSPPKPAKTRQTSPINSKPFSLHRYIPSSPNSNIRTNAVGVPSSVSKTTNTSLSASTSPYRSAYRRQRSMTRELSKQQPLGSDDNINKSRPITSIDTTLQSSTYSNVQSQDSTSSKLGSHRSVDSNIPDQDSRRSINKNVSLDSMYSQFSDEKKTQNDQEEGYDEDNREKCDLEQILKQKHPQSPTQLHVRGVGPVIQDDDLDQIDKILHRNKDGVTTTSVLYNEGATPLFKAIEEQDWKEVERICADEPHQAAIWVVSTGTVQTTFNWSLWKRLPVHELCRRNPTVQALYCLINAYPDGCRAVTQFGELPLHLAVECGASSTIVTALITANWRGVFQCDQVGRTPIDVFRDTEVLLDHNEYVAVRNVFELSTHTYNEMQSEQEQEIVFLRQKHEFGLQAIRDQHDNDLLVEQEQHEKLVQQISGLQKVVQTLKMKVTEQSNVIQHHGTIQQQRELDYHTLFAEKDRYQYELRQSGEQNDKLQGLIAKYEHQLINTNEQIVQLQNALKGVAQYQTSVLQQQSERTTARLELALRSYNDMTDAIDDHAEHLKSLLEKFITPIPPPPSFAASSITPSRLSVQQANIATTSPQQQSSSASSSISAISNATPASTNSSSSVTKSTTHPLVLGGDSAASTTL
jgi:hypothetical protein